MNKTSIGGLSSAVTNAPGQSAIHYRVGDFASFRAALLRPLANETELTDWRPAPGDLALQLVEWWAYLGDVLTFYNEQIANGFYLKTAVPNVSTPPTAAAVSGTPPVVSAPSSSGDASSQSAPAPAMLARLIGYSPPPATATTATLAAVTNGALPMTLPQAFSIRSKPGPGAAAMFFEADDQVSVKPSGDGGVVRLDTVQATSISSRLAGPSAAASPQIFTASLLVRGTAPGLKAGAIVIVAPNTAASTKNASSLVVQSVTPEPDPLGRLNTRVLLAWTSPAAPSGVTAPSLMGDVSSFQILWSDRSLAPVAPPPTATLPVGPSQASPAPASPTSTALATVPSSALATLSWNPLTLARAAWLSFTHLFLSLWGGARTPSASASSSNALPSVTPLPDAVPTNLAANEVVLASTAPTLTIGNFVVVESAPSAPLTSNTLTLTTLSDYSEAVNRVTLKRGIGPAEANKIRTTLQAATVRGKREFTDDQVNAVIASLASGSELATRVGVMTLADDVPTALRVHYGFQVVKGFLVGESPSVVSTGATLAFSPRDPLPSPSPSNAVSGAVSDPPPAVLIEDATGVGVNVVSATEDESGALQVTLANDANYQQLVQPLRLLYNTFTVSEGKTIGREVVGSGDATVGGQSFTLGSAPLIFVGSPPEPALRVFVNDVEWKRVDTFLGRSANDAIFVLTLDPSQRATVVFGDGVRGARLPTGNGNVTARYRYGSAATLAATPPPVTALVNVVTPQPGLSAIRNPLSVVPGQPAATANAIQQSAPSAAQSLGRAVSAADFEAVAKAAGAPWARAVTVWDAPIRLATLVVFVGVAGDSAAFGPIEKAVWKASDPQRRAEVRPGVEVDIAVTVRVTVTPGWDPSAIESAVRTALGNGPLSPSNLYVDAPPPRSRLAAACFSVDGVVDAEAEVRIPPEARTEGTFFRVPKGSLTVEARVEGS